MIILKINIRRAVIPRPGDPPITRNRHGPSPRRPLQTMKPQARQIQIIRLRRRVKRHQNLPHTAISPNAEATRVAFIPELPKPFVSERSDHDM